MKGHLQCDHCFVYLFVCFLLLLQEGKDGRMAGRHDGLQYFQHPGHKNIASPSFKWPVANTEELQCPCIRHKDATRTRELSAYGTAVCICVILLDLEHLHVTLLSHCPLGS